MSAGKSETQTRRGMWWGLGGFAAVLLLSALTLGSIVAQRPKLAAASVIGGPFRLESGGGMVVTDADLRGAPFLVFFGYTHCPDVCPTTLLQLSQVLGVLGPQARIKVLFITVDPERDTPETMQDYASNFDPRIIGLSGDKAAVDNVLAAYRVYARKAPDGHGGYSMDHSAVTYLMDRDGKFLRAFNVERKPEEAAAELKAAL